MVEIEGVVPALSTPFTAAGAVDTESLRRIAREHAQNDAGGVMLFGLASEFYKLTDDERDRIAEVAIDELDGTGTPVIYSITDHSTSVAVERAQKAERYGADIVMILPPAFLDPPKYQVKRHIERISDSVSVPVAIQYAPQFTRTALSTMDLIDLADRIRNLNYLKIESEPIGPYLSEVQKRTSADVLVGNAGWQMLEAYDRGAIGVIPGSPISHIYIDIDDFYRKNEPKKAASLHGDLLPLLNYITQSAEMAFYYGKRILHRRGLIDEPTTRAPTYNPDEQDDERFETLFAEID